jgi:hypothetical protein
MTINDREIIVIKYSTETNWIKDIPKTNWLCILVDNDRTRNYIDEVVSKLINNDVCYVCTVGQSCEKNHDLIDEEITFREVDIDNLYLPKHNIMTTWHTDFEEGVWFAFFAAHHEAVTIDKVVILDMSDGKEIKRIEKLLEEFKVRG